MSRPAAHPTTSAAADPRSRPRIVSAEDVEAGAREPFADGGFYDWEYRRRRADVRFYRTLVGERGGPVLDLGCGTGRMLVPLVRDGHTVVGVDLSPGMLAAARARISRLRASAQNRAALIRGDMTALRFRRRFGVVLVGFHGLQHVNGASHLERFFRRARAALVSGGWLVFDVFLPSPTFLARDPARAWDRTVFRHPGTGQRTAYSLRQRHDVRRGLLLMEMTYRRVDRNGREQGPARVVRLCHRLWTPPEIDRHLSRAGFRVLARYAGFDGTPWSTSEGARSEQLIVVARPESP